MLALSAQSWSRILKRQAPEGPPAEPQFPPGPPPWAAGGPPPGVAGGPPPGVAGGPPPGVTGGQPPFPQSGFPFATGDCPDPATVETFEEARVSFIRFLAQVNYYGSGLKAEMLVKIK